VGPESPDEESEGPVAVVCSAKVLSPGPDVTPLDDGTPAVLTDVSEDPDVLASESDPVSVLVPDDSEDAAEHPTASNPTASHVRVMGRA